MITILQSQDLMRLILKYSKARSSTYHATKTNNWVNAASLIKEQFSTSDELVKYIESLVEPQ